MCDINLLVCFNFRGIKNDANNLQTLNSFIVETQNKKDLLVCVNVWNAVMAHYSPYHTNLPKVVTKFLLEITYTHLLIINI